LNLLLEAFLVMRGCKIRRLLNFPHSTSRWQRRFRVCCCKLKLPRYS
jgi:hypothetical protein